MYDGQCGWPPQWRDAARGWGDSAVLAGSIGLHATRGRQLTAGDLTGMLTRAAAAGELTAALAACTTEPGRSRAAGAAVPRPRVASTPCAGIATPGRGAAANPVVLSHGHG